MFKDNAVGEMPGKLTEPELFANKVVSLVVLRFFFLPADNCFATAFLHSLFCSLT